MHFLWSSFLDTFFLLYNLASTFCNSSKLLTSCFVNSLHLLCILTRIRATQLKIHNIPSSIRTNSHPLDGGIVGWVKSDLRKLSMQTKNENYATLHAQAMFNFVQNESAKTWICPPKIWFIRQKIILTISA